MDELSAELYGFDYRGPASSEALNQLLENVGTDLGVLLEASYRLKNEVTLISNQTLKQTYALSRKLATLSTRDSGSNCKADLTDATVLLTTDRDEVSIPAANRLVHKQQYPCIMPPVDTSNWLARDGVNERIVADGVDCVVEAVAEVGTVGTLPLSLAIAGPDSLFYERILSSASIPETAQTTSLFFGVPQTRTGTGYPNSNYITFMPFPLYTTNMRVWYTLDSEPVLSVAGSSWNDWPTYVTDLRHATVYKTECMPLYTSFPTANITAIRIDMQQPFYLVELTDYVFSYGLGELELGIIKATTNIAIGTVKITKPTGNFTSIGTDDGNVTLSNIASADLVDVVSTYAWVDPEDATIAYVEITLLPNAITDGQIPIITEVSVDYT
jgi:hypothetical protein